MIQENHIFVLAPCIFIESPSLKEILSSGQQQKNLPWQQSILIG